MEWQQEGGECFHVSLLRNKVMFRHFKNICDVCLFFHKIYS